MDSLGAIYEPETFCPFALTLRQPLKPDFIPFWFKRINPISLGVLHDSYNGLLYVLHGILTLANNLNWISRGLHIVPEALHNCITADAHSGRVTPNGKGSIKAIHDITSCRTAYMYVEIGVEPLYRSLYFLTKIDILRLNFCSVQKYLINFHQV